jgi:hypothetical protein
VPKVHNKPIKRPRKGSNKERKRQPKCALVWRTGLSGVPPDSVRCTREPDSELATFGNSGVRFVIIHRTVRCASGATATTTPTVACNSIKCATVRAEVRHAPEGTPDSLQDLSGVPPDCPVAQMSEAPTVRIQRPGDVVGAPDCPVRHATEALTNSSFSGWGYKSPQPPHFNASKFSAFKHLIRAIAFNTRHNQRDQIISQVQRSFQSNSD